MQLFYTPDIKNDHYTLAEQESKHCIRVLRMKNSDTLHLTDGLGNLYKAEIEDANAKACQLKIIDIYEKYGQRAYKLHIAIAPTKSIDRFEWFLEKATEIGVDEITPIICENSERKVVKQERLERIVVSAMKQSLKAFKPILNPLISFNELIDIKVGAADSYIAHCNKGEKVHLKEACTAGKNTLILIGPEGDFSLQETDRAILAGIQPISMGTARLRTETAGIVACHSIAMLNQ